MSLTGIKRAYRPQAPIFRRVLAEEAARTPAADPIPLPPIIPLWIFVARRDHFDAVADTGEADEAIALAFRELPLAEHGWSPSKTSAKRVEDAIGLVWRFERLE